MEHPCAPWLRDFGQEALLLGRWVARDATVSASDVAIGLVRMMRASQMDRPETIDMLRRLRDELFPALLMRLEGPQLVVDPQEALPFVVPLPCGGDELADTTLDPSPQKVCPIR